MYMIDAGSASTYKTLYSTAIGTAKTSMPKTIDGMTIKNTEAKKNIDEN